MEFTSLWDDASRDAENEARLTLNVAAKIAAAPAWSFLANARTRTDFEERLDYAADRLYLAAQAATRANPELTATVYAELLDSLRADFEVLSKSWDKPWEKGKNDDESAEGDKEDKTPEDENDSPNENDPDSDSDEDDNDDDDAAGDKKHKEEDDGDGDPSPKDKKGKPFGKKATYPGHNDHRGDAYQRPFNWDQYHSDVNNYGSGVGPAKYHHTDDIAGSGMPWNSGTVEPDYDEMDSHASTCPTCGQHTGSRHPLA